MTTTTLSKLQPSSSRQVDRVGKRPLPLPLMVFTLLFFACQGHFSFQLGDEAVGGSLPGAVATRVPSLLGDILIPGMAYSAVLFLVINDFKAIVSFANHFKMLTSLAVLSSLSCVWSQNPTRSFGYGLFYLVGTLFAYWMVLRLETREIIILLVTIGVVICLLGLLLILFLPKYGTAHDVRSLGAWRGIFSNRTGAAKVLTFLISPGLIRWERSLRGRQIFYVLLLSLMLVKLHAVSSFVVLAVYIGTLLVLRFGRSVGTKLSLAIFLLGAIGCSLIALVGYFYLPEILDAFGRDSTLTGRTTIWAVLIDSILKRPLLGYGFYSFWLGLTGESAAVIHATNWTFGYAHNGYLEVFLQLGFLGGVIFVCTLINALKDAWICARLDRLGISDWYIGLIVITVIYNLDEATVFWPNDLTSILYILVCCGLSIAAKQLKQPTPSEIEGLR